MWFSNNLMHKRYNLLVLNSPRIVNNMKHAIVSKNWHTG